MKIGSIVKLKDSFSGWKNKNQAQLLQNNFGYRFPVKGEYYVVRNLIHEGGATSLYFEEIINPKIRLPNEVPFEVGFNANHFVEVLPPQSLSKLLRESEELTLELAA